MADIVERLKAHDLNICPDWRDETECHAWIDLADALLSEAAIEIATLRQQGAEARAKAFEEAAAEARGFWKGSDASSYQRGWDRCCVAISDHLDELHAAALSAPKGREG